MYSADDIADALRPTVPAHLRDSIPLLSRLLADLASGALSDEDAKARIVSDQLEPLLAALAGQRIDAGGATLSFGQGNQLGDVSVRDVAGGSIIHLTVNIYNAELGASNRVSPGTSSSRTRGARSAASEASGAPRADSPATNAASTSPASTQHPTAEFIPPWPWRLGRIAGGGLAALLGLGGLLYAASIALGLAGTGDGAGVAAVMGILLLIFGAMFAREGYGDNERILVFPDRLERHTRGRVSTYKWDDVRRAWKRITVHRGSSSRIVKAIPGFKLELRGGQVVEIGLDWDGGQADRLDDLIRREVSRRLLPHYRSQYNAGRPVSFGQGLSLSREGVLWGKQLIRWERVRGADFEAHNVLLLTSDSSPPNEPMRMRLGEGTANYFLFVALVNEIVAARRW